MKIQISEVTLELTTHNAVLHLGGGETISLSRSISQEIYAKFAETWNYETHRRGANKKTPLPLAKTQPSPLDHDPDKVTEIADPFESMRARAEQKVPPPPPMPTFPQPREAVQIWWATRRKRREETGECVYCDKPAQKEYMMCRKHLTMRRKINRKPRP